MGPVRRGRVAGARGALSVACVAASLFASAAAHASPSAKLTYVRGVGAEKCPDEATLRRAVAERLGFDVFFPWARRTVVAEITKGPRGFHARLQFLGDDGVVLGARSIDATTDSCVEVAQALALAMSIAVDDFGLDEVPPPATPPQPAEPSLPEPPVVVSLPTPSPKEVPPPIPAPARSPRFDASLLAFVSFGDAPAPGVGARASFAVLLPRSFSLGIELAGTLPASGNDSARGAIETYLVTGSLVPCLRWPRPFFVCGVVSLGDFHERGVGVSVPNSGDDLIPMLAPRVGVEVPLGSRFFVRAQADGTFALVRPRVTVGGAVNAPHFQVAAFFPAVDLGAGLTF